MVVDQSSKNPWPNLGIGLVFAIVIPIASILLFLTLIGSYAAMVLLAWLLLAYFVVSLLSVMFLGLVILRWLKKHDKLDWQAVVLGTVVLFILRFIPILGWLICALTWLLVFGAALRLAKERIKNETQNGTSI